jgi:hypothetical protein|tara:strand:+ start:86 stop:712 length:627 start_codon:yes stop_codon:yes gene_type:complete
MELEKVENLIQESTDDGRLFNELSKSLAEELKRKELLAELIKTRVEEIINENIDGSFQEKKKEWFGAKVEKEYFERRDSMERVTFKLIRNEDKGIILEAYQRLAEGEEDWAQISNRWGIDPEKKFDGKYKQMRVNKLNHDLVNALKRNDPGKISQPIRLGKYFGIVQLDEWMSVELNETMREKIEGDLYNEWIDEQANRACNLIQSNS